MLDSGVSSGPVRHDVALDERTIVEVEEARRWEKKLFFPLQVGEGWGGCFVGRGGGVQWEGEVVVQWEAKFS